MITSFRLGAYHLIYIQTWNAVKIRQTVGDKLSVKRNILANAENIHLARNYFNNLLRFPLNLK